MVEVFSGEKAGCSFRRSETRLWAEFDSFTIPVSPTGGLSSACRAICRCGEGFRGRVLCWREQPDFHHCPVSCSSGRSRMKPSPEMRKRRLGVS